MKTFLGRVLAVIVGNVLCVALGVGIRCIAGTEITDYAHRMMMKSEAEKILAEDLDGYVMQGAGISGSDKHFIFRRGQEYLGIHADCVLGCHIINIAKTEKNERKIVAGDQDTQRLQSRKNLPTGKFTIKNQSKDSENATGSIN